MMIITLQLTILTLLISASIQKDGYKVTIISMLIAVVIASIGSMIWEAWGWV